jgi:hypothetical protein
MKADLHYHGAIGFQPEWLKMQGYSGMNLSKLIADAAIAKGIGLVAITSESLGLSEGHNIHNRFYRLSTEARTLPSEYSHDKLGDVALIIEKKRVGKVIIVNGQTVLVSSGDKRYDHLVIGSNEVPNLRSFRFTVNYCFDNGLPNFLEHPLVLSHYGVGGDMANDLLETHHEAITGIEGHNAQMIFPEKLSFLPFIGNYNRGANNAAIQLARKFEKPFISTSDGHRIGDVGTAYIEFEDKKLDLSNEDRFLASLKRILEKGQFTTCEKYIDLFSWLKWTSTFAFGTKAFPKLKL